MMSSTSSSDGENEKAPLLSEAKVVQKQTSKYAQNYGTKKSKDVLDANMVEDGAHKPSEIVTNFDQILEHIGDIGWWQFLSIALIWLPSMAGGIIVLLLR